MDDDSLAEHFIEEENFPFTAIGGIIANKATIARLNKRREMILKQHARKEAA